MIQVRGGGGSSSFWVWCWVRPAGPRDGWDVGWQRKKVQGLNYCKDSGGKKGVQKTQRGGFGGGRVRETRSSVGGILSLDANRHPSEVLSKE